MADTRPGDGPGDQLKRYWTRDPRGLAKWATKPHPWTSLFNHLVKHLNGNKNFAARLTETYFVEVFGFHSGSRKGRNPTGPG